MTEPARAARRLSLTGGATSACSRTRRSILRGNTTGDVTESEGAVATDTLEERDQYVDFLRGFSLVVVVIWHWAFTIIRWRADGPHATSPLGFTSQLWIFTWLLQVLPLFFYIGGYVHLG